MTTMASGRLKPMLSVICFLSVGLHGLAENCALTPTNLSHLWPGEQTAEDVVGGNNGALLPGASFAAAMVGSGFMFDGIGFVVVPNAPELRLSSDSPSTLDSWVFPTSFAPVLYVPLTATKSYYYGLLYSPLRQHIRAHVHDGSHWIFADGPYILPLNTWTHVAQTWDGTTLNVYANGELIGAGAVDGLPDAREEAPLLIGRWQAPAPRDEDFPFIGIIDEVGIYTRALASSEISAIFSAGSLGLCRGVAGVQPHCGFAPVEARTSLDTRIEFSAVNWSFGDGTTSGDVEAAHAYAAAGTYPVTVTLTTPEGNVTMAAGEVAVFEAAPQAGFTGTSLVGPAPLTVQFADESKGDIANRNWDFGDGGTSSATHPTHTFATEGNFEVKLTVTGRCPESEANESVATSTVVVGSLPFVEVVQTSPHCATVAISSAVPFFGGELGIAYHPGTVTPRGVRPGPDLATGARLLFEADPPLNCTSEAGVKAGFTLGWINSFTEQQPTPPGKHELFVICFDAAPGASIGDCSPLRFVSCLGVQEGPVRNIITLDGNMSAMLFTLDGELCLKPDQPFRRGDANADRSFDISDALTILGCLFLGSECPACPDSMDGNDDGLVNIADPSYLLNWRFLGGPSPPLPFPACGQDPTADDLDECGGMPSC